MNRCDAPLKPTEKHRCVGGIAVDPTYYHNNNTAPNGIDGLDIREPMAAEKLDSWFQNGHLFLQSHNTTHNQPSKTPLGLDTLIYNQSNGDHSVQFRNGLQHYHLDKNQSLEINNNSEKISEMEAHVMDILTTKYYCTVVDIQKSLPAVTSPKVVEYTIESLSSKGRVELVHSNPQTWTKARPKPLRGQYRNARTHSYGGNRSFFSERIPMQEQDNWHQGSESSFINNTGLNRSVSSPSFQKACPTLFKQPRRKISEPSGDEMSKTLRQGRRVWRSSLGEDELQGLTLHSLDIDPQEQGIIGGLSMTNGSPPCDFTKNTDFGVPHNGRFQSENMRSPQRLKQKSIVGSFRPRRDPGVIGGERTYKPNPRSKSFEETWLSGKQGYRGEYDRHNEDVRQRSRSFDSDGDSKCCGLCKISFTSKQQFEEHFQSTKHQNKMAKVTSDPYLKFCDYCKVGLNSKSQAQEHFSSGRHEQTVAKSQKAPIRNHPPLTTNSENFKPLILTETKPRKYQVELYTKAMTTNSVCFVPTGAGKTLVSALVVAHLLCLNPSRQIIFLVDRVLLVIQQSDYLKCELKNFQIPLSAKDEEQTARPRFSGQYRQFRPLRVGAICGEMRKLETGIPVFNHDILVVTADCYRNHINNGTLRFEDSALIVLDESHHCNKDHPYNVIIRDYYLPDEIPLYDRPKILGLTASPAGEPSLDRTVKKMQRLLMNLGHATLLNVSDQIQELTEKTNQADIICRCAEYTPTEKSLLGILMEYATKCFNLTARVSEFKEYKDVFQPSSGGVLSKEDISPILEVIDKFSILSKPQTNPVNSLLHFKTICEAICALQECGEKIAADRMMELLYGNLCSYGFDWAKDQGLPCENIKSYMEQYSARVSRSVDDVGSGIYELFELLVSNINREEQDDSLLALVLVKRSQIAVRLAKFLDASLLRTVRGIRAVSLVGNEAQRPYQGIPTQQSETLANIREGAYQIVIATNVNEEVLGLPASKLVVILDPPNAVSALSQIRACVRDSKTTYAAVCRESTFAKKIKELLLRESNMMQAAQFINSNGCI